MNVESATTSAAVITKTSDTSSSSATSKTDSSTSFQDELKSADTKDAQQTPKQAESTDTNSQTAENQNAQNTDSAKTAQENAAKQVAQEKLNKENEKISEKDETTETKNVSNTFKELNSQITALNEIKNSSKTQSTSKKDEKTSDLSSYCHTMKMDNNDITFFVNLVENQQMTAQTTNQTGIKDNAFTEIKTAETQSTVQVSATLLDALNESVKTNKPFRIDFDNDIAVIMKVDKDGVLSANFIPGSAAVENYLRNNIESLRQSFNEQNLPYNELSYSNQQKREKQEESQNNKENENE